MRITLNLLREKVQLDKDVLRDGDKFEEVAVRNPGGEAVSWRLFVRSMPPKPAAWTENVAPIVVDPTRLANLKTQSNAGVLLVKTDGRVFALTFGFGYHALDPAKIEPSFGLRVTANVVARDNVTSADTKGFNQSSRSQKTIMPSAGEFSALGVEPAEEWVRQMSGKVGDESFASTAAGADSLRLSIKDFSISGLPGKLDQILGYYRQETYKEHFGFLDNFTRLTTKDSLVGDLDDRLTAMVVARDVSVAFAAPDPFEQINIHHYRIQYRKAVDIDELSTEAVYASLGKLKFKSADNVLRKVTVRALDEDDQDVDRKYDLYDYAQVELDHTDGHRYALTSGSWFRIDRHYLKEIEDFVASLADISDELSLADWHPTELIDKERKDATAEGLYNERLAEMRNWQLLDKKDLHFAQYKKIEICDLLTPDRQLICVKRASKSSTLSHLFAQASVSASLMHERAYQARVMGSLREMQPGADYGRREDWTFVYAVATSKDGPLGKSLFFFSKVNLAASVKHILALGYKAALARIAIVEDSEDAGPPE